MKDIYDTPITEAEADRRARQYGFAFAGFMTEGDKVELTAAGIDYPPDRHLAVFAPLGDEGGAMIWADGRTQYRALQRGVTACAMQNMGLLGSVARKVT